jgi:hypothetical protein
LTLIQFIEVNMALRFRKTVKLLPGVKLNISKSGVSTSHGVNGATLNLKKGRAMKTTLGIPGSGISHTSHGRSKSRAGQTSVDTNSDEFESEVDHETALRAVEKITGKKIDRNEKSGFWKAFISGLLWR